MSKKKKTKQVNHTTSNQPEIRVMFDFDYDKLANIILEKNIKPKAPVLTKTLKGVLSNILLLTTSSLIIITVAFAIHMYKSIANYTGVDSINDILACFMLIIYSVVLTIITIKTAKEINKINDYSILSPIFANILAIIALIISVFALNKSI